MSKHLQGYELLPEKILRLEDLRPGEFFVLLKGDEAGRNTRPRASAFVYQVIDCDSMGPTFGTKKVVPAEGVVFVYNASSAYLAPLDSQAAVLRLGPVKLVQVEEASE